MTRKVKTGIDLTKHKKDMTMAQINNKGQNLLEYAIVVTLVSAAVVAMSTYVFRSVQATQRSVTQDFENE